MKDMNTNIEEKMRKYLKREQLKTVSHMEAMEARIIEKISQMLSSQTTSQNK
eukprot:CAMPEP_0115037466 /NCGR_PEP_ID=MMETSP0216-20121206/42818_1 /TAXON_ID=223996 /ORGANISM="Protocruzia adherens, Strain Boccale" /LENGTH=51 /DNA_ID=CAMNT_0002417657 /DNA_START=86 /DNA_END=241 /DNA_ORIENTATION=+